MDNSSHSQNVNYNYIIPVNDLSVQTNIEDLTCIICLGICFKPVLITCCERLLCLECTKMMIKMSSGSNLKCPYCNEQNINFEKPSKLILRLFENLTLFCGNKSLGCKESVKYHFYFDHLYNTCEYKSGVIGEKEVKYCKNCLRIYGVYLGVEHKCILGEESLVQSQSELERKLDQLYTFGNNSLSGINSTNTSSNSLQRGVVNIPKLHIHNLTLTNERLTEGYEQGWLCELCNDNIRNPATKSYHCEKCTYDICEKCVLYISTRKPSLTCHKHELNLEIRDLEWECQICDNYYFKRRAWYCDLCDFDVCVYCYWKS